MKVVSFNATVPRYLLAKSLGWIWPGAIFGSLGLVHMRDLQPPEPPAASWVALDVLACGICGSDLSAIKCSASPTLEPFASFPAVLGHEILARVAEVGAGVDPGLVGRRVSLDPTISCTMRGHTVPCQACQDGHPGTCSRAADPGPTRVLDRQLGPGITIGFHRDLPGGFCERIIAHSSQIYPVPEEVGDDTAVLTEPFSVAMHAVLATPVDAREPVLVIGSGAIALGVIWALRATGFAGEVVSQVRRPHEARAARLMGASETVQPGSEARAAVVKTGARGYKPMIGPEVYAGGGFPVIFDCVGSRETLDQALRSAAVRGRIVVLGCAGTIPKLDLSFLWARELEVHGSVCYGAEEWRGERTHTFQVTHALMRESGDDLARLVTHQLPLARYREALRLASNHRTSGALKVVLNP